MQIDIYIPTLGRSHKLVDYINHVRENTLKPHRIICIVERSDMDSYNESVAAGAITIINHRSPNYAGAINSAWDCLQSELFFAGADDLRFYPGWLERALQEIEKGWLVVGTNDLHNEEVAHGEHATHYLVSGKYINQEGGVIDGKGAVLCELYSHNYTDREFIGTSKYRGVFTPCTESIVEHLHFTFGLSQFDSTYHKTRVGVDADCQIYEKRRDQWKRM